MAVKLGKGWKIAQTSGKAGTGNWSASALDLDQIAAAGEHWKRAASGIEKPWLCWNINDDWCVVQQKLALSVGWTPIVGWDPNCAPPRRTVLPGAVEIDFNEPFGFPAMWPHFPLEFAFLWTERLAFWHADLLVRKEKLRQVAEMFANLRDGEMAAVRSIGGLRNLLNFRSHRYWELLGCVTRGASKNNFDLGCGWWRNFHLHPNCPEHERRTRAKYYYDSGVGIMYWHRRYNGRIFNIREKWINEGHCTQIGNKSYVNAENKGAELSMNFDLRQIAQKLDLLDLL